MLSWLKHMIVGWNWQRALLTGVGAAATEISHSAGAPWWVQLLCAGLAGGGLVPTPGHAPAPPAQDRGATLPPG